MGSALAGVAVVALAGLLTPGAGAVPPGKPAPAVPGKILLRWQPGATQSERAAILAAAGVRVERRMLLSRLELLHTHAGVSVPDAIARLERAPTVRYAEPDLIVRLQATPNDPLYPSQWALNNTGQTVNGVTGPPGTDISAEPAWELTTGSRDVVVAVIDSGVAYDHPDLAANIWRNEPECTGLLGVDDDANGLLDDCRGWDFVDRDADPYETHHGTYVAGIIGAQGHDGFGVAGVNWRVSAIPLRVCTGTCASDRIIDAVTYAGLKKAAVANMSFGGTGFLAAEKDAIDSAPETLFIAAAGNDARDNDQTAEYPCAYSSANLICVAASDQRDALANFSNYGGDSVDLGAPSPNILSTAAALEVLFQDSFDDLTARRWDYGEATDPPQGDRWQRAAGNGGDRIQLPGSTPSVVYLTDSGGGTNIATTLDAPIDLSGEDGCSLGYQLKLATAADEELLVEASRAHDGPYSTLAVHRGSATWFTDRVSLNEFTGGPLFLRFRVRSDAFNPGGDVSVDDVTVACESEETSYGYFGGTSAASPMVAGAAALIWSAYPDATVAEVKQRIRVGVDQVPSLQGKTVTGGRLNVYRSLELPAPVTAITGHPDSQTRSITARFDLTVDDPQATLECSIDGADFAGCESPVTYSDLSEGRHSFAARATDRAGNTESPPQGYSWEVDLAAPQAPQITPASKPPDPTKQTGAAFEFSAAEPGGSLECKLDAAPFAPCSSPKTYANLAEGTHTFEVRQTDAAGNQGPNSFHTWQVDLTAPAAPAITAASKPPNPTNQNAASFEFSAAEPGSSLECKLDAAPFAPCSSPKTYTGLSEGSHSFEVRQTDAAGNQGPNSSHSWSVDLSAPESTIESAPATMVSANVASFEFSSSESGSLFECALDGQAPEPCGSPWTYTGLAEGPHTFALWASDAAGNRESSPALHAWTVRLEQSGPGTGVGGAAAGSPAWPPPAARRLPGSGRAKKLRCKRKAKGRSRASVRRKCRRKR